MRFNKFRTSYCLNFNSDFIFWEFGNYVLNKKFSYKKLHLNFNETVELFENLKLYEMKKLTRKYSFHELIFEMEIH